jgi:hypothetical protein
MIPVGHAVDLLVVVKGLRRVFERGEDDHAFQSRVLVQSETALDALAMVEPRKVQGQYA